MSGIRFDPPDRLSDDPHAQTEGDDEGPESAGEGSALGPMAPAGGGALPEGHPAVEEPRGEEN
jgi:hypothetical protein